MNVLELRGHEGFRTDHLQTNGITGLGGVELLEGNPVGAEELVDALVGAEDEVHELPVVCQEVGYVVLALERPAVDPLDRHAADGLDGQTEIGHETVDPGNLAAHLVVQQMARAGVDHRECDERYCRAIFEAGGHQPVDHLLALSSQTCSLLGGTVLATNDEAELEDDGEDGDAGNGTCDERIHDSPFG